MTQLRNLDKTTQEQLLLETYLDFEQQHNAAGKKNILTRMHHILEFFGAIQLGLFVASLTIFLNFLVVNLILHL